ncbi:MAG: thioredoxin domain-containing protein [Acidobacteriota bacterium]
MLIRPSCLALLLLSSLNALAATPSMPSAPVSATKATAKTSSKGEQEGTSRPSQNRLAGEKSRYLLEHADNAVQWLPWGDEAFTLARKSDKPVFLSIGYASCHWCHVMERESFERGEVAEMINRYFVPVLVDREEHPDVDATYMAYLEAMTGGGGWPANFIVTPDRKPVIGATYLKPEALNRLLVVVSNRWSSDRPALLASTEQLALMVRSMRDTSIPAADVPGAPLLGQIAAAIKDSYDREHGGFGTAPKFPQPLLVGFLIRESARRKDDLGRTVVLGTLHGMASGAIHDQIGGGFHRYTTDAGWQVPHYEKMLYDQALMAIAYTEAWQWTHDPAFGDVARDTLDYALRDLRNPAGGFDSGQDADSIVAGRSGPMLVEGLFYFWSSDEVTRLLGAKTADVINYYYGLGATKKLPYVAHSAAETRKKFGLSESEFATLLTTARTKMLDVRRKRPRPFRDDKMLAGWNGLMISALARGGTALDDSRYTNAAAETARFVLAKLYDRPAKRLSRRYRNGSAGIDALPEDYALLIQGLLDAYESSFDIKLLTTAVELQNLFDAKFWVETAARYQAPAGPLGSVVTETDSPIPTANSVAAMNLQRLGEMTDNKAWRARASLIFRSFATQLSESPASLPQLASALSMSLSTPKQIVIAGERSSQETHALMRVINGTFVPNRVVLLADGSTGQAQLARWLPFVEAMTRLEKHSTAYICESYACKMPSFDPAQIARLLE